MSHLRPTHLVFLFLLHCLFLLSSPANAVPLGLKRQLSDNQPQTLTTQTVTSTPSGDMTQTCVITLTPITDSNGNAAVQEVKSCTLSLAGTNNAGSSTGTNTTSSSPPETTSSSGNSTTDTSGTSSSSGGDAVSANAVSQVTPSATDSTAATATDSTAASATDSTAASATDSSAASATDSSGASATDSGAAATSTDTGSNLGAAAVSAGGVVQVSANPTANAGAASATPVAAAENAASASSSAFVVPGQSIQVLPIGLGIFGGISGIALIVVLYLTYKRRAYRKAFRARKLAEEGAAMGYGGTRT